MRTEGTEARTRSIVENGSLAEAPHLGGPQTVDDFAAEVSISAAGLVPDGELQYGLTADAHPLDFDRVGNRRAQKAAERRTQYRSGDACAIGL
jgi:hypothetical protein